MLCLLTWLCLEKDMLMSGTCWLNDIREFKHTSWMMPRRKRLHGPRRWQGEGGATLGWMVFFCRAASHPLHLRNWRKCVIEEAGQRWFHCGPLKSAFNETHCELCDGIPPRGLKKSIVTTSSQCECVCLCVCACVCVCVCVRVRVPISVWEVGPRIINTHIHTPTHKNGFH